MTRAAVPQPEILVVAASARRRQALTELIHRTPRYKRASVLTSLSFGLELAEINVADLESPGVADPFLRTAENAPATAGFVALIDSPPAVWLGAAIHAGVNAVLSRELTSDELELGIEAAEQGMVLLSPPLAQMLTSPHSQTLEFSDLVEQLTIREHEVLDLMSAGLSNKQIATELGISEHTAKFHISSVLGKLGVNTRTEAVSRGIRTGLISL